jgi:prophage maintenance system killer protein
VRKVMVHYVIQIDSLNIENKELKAENTQLRRTNEETSHTVEQLAKDKDNLTEVVTRASKLEVIDCNVQKLNNKNKRTSLLSQLAYLEFNITLHKNITAETGLKTVYLRITTPEGNVLAKSSKNLFAFEDKQITYSEKKEIEYAGDEMTEKIYWEVDETVFKGNYKADFFIDGQLAGTYNFVLRKY